MLTNSALETVMIVVAETAPNVALITAVPAIFAVARPALSILATSTLALAHVACCDRSWLLPSEKIPVAVKANVRPLATVGASGVI